MLPIIFYKDEIINIENLEEMNGPFGHFSNGHGLLELNCLQWGSDMIEEVLESQDDSQILRMLECMSNNFGLLKNKIITDIDLSNSDNHDYDQGTIYLEQLENSLESLIKYNDNHDVITKSEGILEELKKQRVLYNNKSTQRKE